MLKYLDTYYLKRNKLVIISLFLFMPICSVFAQLEDSSQLRRLPEVSIERERSVHISPGSSATQMLNAKQISALPSIQLSDALKFMSGVVVRDYGGTGGMKTVSVRGLGSQHTGVAYCGVPLSDCQTGQIDLGKLSLDNVASLSLMMGVPEDIFIPASFFSHSSLLFINMMNELPKNPVKIKAAFTVGSYGLISPQVFCAHYSKSKKKTDRYILWNLSGNYTQSKGDYPYLLHYGGINDSVSHERRQNSDVSIFNTEVNILYQLDRTQRLSFKWYYYDSERGLPSATTFYNLNSAQRIWNRNTFGQAHYHKYFNAKWAYQLNGKFNYDYTHYLDPTYLNVEGRLDNHYRQYEGFVSNAVQFSPFVDTVIHGYLTNLKFALAQDLIYNQLEANSIDYEHPARFTTKTSLAMSYSNRILTINGDVLLTAVNNLLKEVNVKNHIHASPSVGLSVKLFSALKFRAFYKNIFRMPTFNDLYYREVGNINLNPEKTHQTNVGLVLDQLLTGAGKVQLSFSLDAYYNLVKDKIVAFPSRNLFSWTIINYGKVSVMGSEFNARIQYRWAKQYSLFFNGNCTFQRAVDRTNPNGKTYKHQIPYTPKWSGSANVSVQMPWLTVSYSVILCGKRYALGQNIPANEVEGYVDHSITFGHEVNIKDSKIGFKLELLNLADKNYEVIKNYPMQGSGFRFKIYYEY